PEWVTRLIVEETIGARLGEIRQELGVDELTAVTSDEVDDYLEKFERARKRNKKAPPPSGHRVTMYIAALDEYEKRLAELKVLDPACGSGAFLIQAFQFLYDERV